MEKDIRWSALDRKVIVVAVSNEKIFWAAYIGAVAGKHHDSEWYDVADNGSKLSKELARMLFPDFSKKYIWRD